ncbi:MAG: putative porin [Bacteroides sp.]|jgi:hypothetical protein|nr:putative porin [Bacteroides sp.]
MSRLKAFSCFIFLILGHFSILGQTADTLKPTSEVPWYSEEQLQSPFEALPNIIDTTITGFQLYDFVYRSEFFFVNKGNPGHITRLLQFSPELGHGFQLHSQELFPGYRFKHESLRFYRPVHVYTDLFYVMGSEREQLFNALHNQKFHETLHAGFNYQLVNSPGFYTQTASRNSNIYLTLDFQLPSKRYQALGSFVSNRFENQEGGGLTDRLAFEEDVNSDFVYLPEAQLRHRETALTIHHFYQTGFYVGGAENDTLETRRFINLGRINHEFSWRRLAYVFDDPLPPVGFYETDPFNSNSTFDSTFVNTIQNLVSWSNFPLKSGRGKFPFNFTIFLKHQLVDIKQPLYLETIPGEGEGTDTSDQEYLQQNEQFNQVIQGVELESDQTRFLSGKAFAHLTLGGYNDEDLGIGASINLGKPVQKHQISMQAAFYQQEVPYSFSRFYGNYISWENDFLKQQIGHARLLYQSNWLSLEGNYYLLSNMAYLGPEALPQQNTSTFSLLSAGIGLKAGIGVFQTRHKVLYQYVGEQEFEQFPELVSYHSVFFDFSLFKKAMDLNVGFDLFYNGPYTPMGYMPVVRQFYAQDGFETDHTFLADAFVTIKVKRTRFFLKAQNITSFIPDFPQVYAIPFYPLPGFAFKFGVSWMFFD